MNKQIIIKLKSILESKFSTEQWTIAAPKKGFSKNRRFVATGISQTFFVRIGDNIRVAEILASANIGVPVIFSGYLRNKTPIYFEKFISPKHPDSKWFISNMKVVVEKLQKFQKIRTLNSVLQIQDYISEIEKEYVKVPFDHKYKTDISDMIENLKQGVKSLRKLGLVLCHGDLGSNNILVTVDDFFMIDWETLHLSDPIRDISHIIYWCYPEVFWQEVLGLFGYDIQDPKFRVKFFWHILSRAIYVYLLFVNSNQEELAIDFYYDALNASNYKPASRLLV